MLQWHVSQDVEADNKRQCVKVDVVDKVNFKVPMFEAGSYGGNKYKERKYLGLIEWVGDGISKRLVHLSPFTLFSWILAALL